MARNERFGGTRGIQSNDVGEAAIVEELKAELALGKTLQAAVDAVSVKRRAKMRDILKIAERHGLADTKS